MTVYGPRCNVHPDRTGATRWSGQVPLPGLVRLLVVHTSEGSEGPTSAENLCSFMTLPGDRPNLDGSMFGASYHYVTDTDRVLPAVPDNVVAYAAAGANNDGIHICIPGKAAQTREQWLDAISHGYLEQLAFVMIDKATEHKIPLLRLSVKDIQVGRSGYCGHVDISNAYHKSDHTDPGAAFPWDVLAADLEEPVAVTYFKVPGANPLTIFGTSDGFNATRLEEFTVKARGVDPFTVPTISQAEADKFVYQSGFTAQSVR